MNCPIRYRAHRWVLVNRAFCTLLRKRPDELLGRSDFDFFPPEEASVFHTEDDRAFASGVVLENEEVLTDIGGDRHIIVTKKIAITGPTGEQYLIGIIRDLTERRRVEARLARAEQLASIGALGASVAHEINNPLTAGCANLSFVREQLSLLETLIHRGESPGDIVADLRSALADADDGTRRVARIVEDLRGLAKTDVGSTASVPQAVAAAVRLVAGKARERAWITVDGFRRQARFPGSLEP
jgi:PAS domain S-box-containing protein